MKSSGCDLGELVPGHRRRHRRPRLRPDAVGRGDRAVAGVLVVVDEHVRAALLLPPLRRHLPGPPAFELASKRDRRVADVGERPARLDPHVDVDAAPTRGLRETGVAELVQQLAGRRGHPDGVLEVRARLGIEVDPQLVGVIDVGAPHRPRMEGDRPHLRRPPHDGDLGRADLVGGAPGRELDARRLDIGRRAARDALLVEGVAAALLARGQHDARMHALGPALEGRRPFTEGAHDPRCDREVVLDHLELRDRAQSRPSAGRSRAPDWRRGGFVRLRRSRWLGPAQHRTLPAGPTRVLRGHLRPESRPFAQAGSGAAGSRAEGRRSLHATSAAATKRDPNASVPAGNG